MTKAAQIFSYVPKTHNCVQSVAAAAGACCVRLCRVRCCRWVRKISRTFAPFLEFQKTIFNQAEAIKGLI